MKARPQRPRIGFSLLLWTPALREEHLPLLDVLAEAGFDGVEVPVVLTSEAMLDRTRERCDALGLARTAVGFATPEADPIAEDAAVREEAVRHLGRLCERAARLGAKIVAGPLHSAYATFRGHGPTEEELARSAEVLARAAPNAEELGVRIGLEYLNRFESYLVTTAAQTDRLVRRVDHPAVCTVLDTHHSHIEDPDVGEAIRATAETLGHVQLSESHRGLLGTGQVRWKRAFAALRAIGYDGWLVIESFSRNDPDFAAGLHVWRDPAEDLLAVPREGLAFVRRHLGR